MWCGEEAYEKMKDGITKTVHGTYARLIMVNPLCEGLPALTVFVQCTCNRFDKSHVREQWNLTAKHFEKHLAPFGMMLIGRASDGDARRFSLQKEDMMSAAARSSDDRKFRFRASGR